MPPRGPEYTIDADGTTELGGAGTGTVTTRTLQFVSDGTFDGSIVVQGRARNSDAPYTPIPYKVRSLAGVAATDTIVSDPIVDDALIAIDDAGLDIALETTGTTTGSMDVYPSSEIG